MENYDVKELFGGKTEMISDMANFSVYQTTHRDKSGSIEKYDLFDGIEVYIVDLFTDSIDYGDSPVEFSDDVIAINYCEKGRFEGEFRDGQFIYIGDGETSVNMPKLSPLRNVFPLGQFSGVLIGIQTDEVKKSIAKLSETLGFNNIDIDGIKKRLIEGNRLVIYRNEQMLSLIMSQMYNGSKIGKEFYLKLKVLELLYYISFDTQCSENEYKYYEKIRVNTVKQIREYLIDNLETRFLLPELSDKFKISQTSLKECFKAVYGMPISVYMREYRIDVAADLLLNSRFTISEISGKVGYENQSKFSEVFKKKMNMTPKEYRDKKSSLE